MTTDSDQGLYPFASVFSLEAFEGKPLPCDIYNADFAVRARAGQIVSREHMATSFVLTAKPKADLSSMVSKRARGAGYNIEASVKSIESKLDALLFQPIETVRQGVKRNANEMKDLYWRTLVADASVLTSKSGPSISEGIAQFLYELHEDPALAADYADTMSAVRDRDNYLTFGHGTAMAFYVIAIAKKLKMLRDDHVVRTNLGRWLPVRTTRYAKAVGSAPFSHQLLKSIDRHKMMLQTKYPKATQEKVFERIHDLMHEYAAIDYSQPHPSLQSDFDPSLILAVAVAALTADIGKVALSPEVLTRPGPLEPDEVERMQEHPVLGVTLLKKAGFEASRVFAIILGHHRLTDTIGYPVLPRPPLPESKILGIVDLYDAMRSERHYGRVHSQDEAFLALEGLYREGAFDPVLWVVAKHTFEEFNHDFTKTRNKVIAPIK